MTILHGSEVSLDDLISCSKLQSLLMVVVDQLNEQDAAVKHLREREASFTKFKRQAHEDLKELKKKVESGNGAEKVDERLSALEDLAPRLPKAEAGLADAEARVKDLAREIRRASLEVEQRVTTLEKKIEAQVEQSVAGLEKKVEAQVEDKLAGLEDKIAGLQRLEEAQVEHRIAGLEEKIAGRQRMEEAQAALLEEKLKAQAALLQEKLDSQEKLDAQAPRSPASVGRAGEAADSRQPRREPERPDAGDEQINVSQLRFVQPRAEPEQTDAGDEQINVSQLRYVQPRMEPERPGACEEQVNVSQLRFVQPREEQSPEREESHSDHHTYASSDFESDKEEPVPESPEHPEAEPQARPRPAPLSPSATEEVVLGGKGGGARGDFGATGGLSITDLSQAPPQKPPEPWRREASPPASPPPASPRPAAAGAGAGLPVREGAGLSASGNLDSSHDISHAGSSESSDAEPPLPETPAEARAAARGFAKEEEAAARGAAHHPPRVDVWMDAEKEEATARAGASHPSPPVDVWMAAKKEAPQAASPSTSSASSCAPEPELFSAGAAAAASSAASAASGAASAAASGAAAQRRTSGSPTGPGTTWASRPADDEESSPSGGSATRKAHETPATSSYSGLQGRQGSRGSLPKAEKPRAPPKLDSDTSDGFVSELGEEVLSPSFSASPSLRGQGLRGAETEAGQAGTTQATAAAAVEATRKAMAQQQQRDAQASAADVLGGGNAVPGGFHPAGRAAWATSSRALPTTACASKGARSKPGSRAGAAANAVAAAMIAARSDAGEAVQEESRAAQQAEQGGSGTAAWMPSDRRGPFGVSSLPRRGQANPSHREAVLETALLATSSPPPLTPASTFNLAWPFTA